ncbi:MAG: hypothetical protein ACFE7R_06250, partial [Candidatus Hodarchaeota archaeon]
VLASMPYNVNVTGYAPENQALNHSHFDNESNLVVWNATAFGVQDDYTIFLNTTDLPPLVTIERTFSPGTCEVDGSTTVTVTVTNEGDDPIQNVIAEDLGFAETYPLTTVTGDTSGSWTSLAAGEAQSFTYTVVFPNEGMYGFDNAEVVYEFNNNTYSKTTPEQGFEVTPNVGALAVQAIADGWPYTGMAVGLVALVGLYSIAGLVRGRGSGGGFQM